MDKIEIEKYAVYGIILIIALTVAYSYDGRPVSGYSIWEKDLSMNINSISPSIPEYMDNRIAINFNIKGTEPFKTTYARFSLQYPSGKVIAYTSEIQNSQLQKGSLTKSFQWNIDQHGTYRLTAMADLINNIQENNEENNMDSIIFNV